MSVSAHPCDYYTSIQINSKGVAIDDKARALEKIARMTMGPSSQVESIRVFFPLRSVAHLCFAVQVVTPRHLVSRFLLGAGRDAN
jgi:hypothetical protein